MRDTLRRPGVLGALAGITLAVLAAATLGWMALHRESRETGLLEGNGRLEAVQIDVAARVPGRVAELLVDEGQRVRAGQALVRLDDAPLRAQLDEAHAQLARERDAVVTAGAQLALRRQDVVAAAAGVAERVAERAAAQKRLERSQALFGLGGVSAQELDDDRTRLDVAQAALDAARARVESARAAVATADSQRVEARSAVRAAEAQVHRIALDIADCTVRAAVDGRVEYVIARPGEILPAGSPLLGLVDASRLDFTFFLPEQDAGRVAFGDPARLMLDAFPAHAVPATVSYVSSVAQFTPKTVETARERQKMMFRVKARVDPATAKALPSLKSGMPGMAYLRGDRESPWPPRLALVGAP